MIQFWHRRLLRNRLLASLLALTLTLSWSLPAKAQLENLFSSSSVEQGSSDIRAYECAYQLVCADLMFDSKYLFTVVAEPSTNAEEAAVLPARERVSAIQDVLSYIAKSGVASDALKVEAGVFDQQTVILVPEQSGLRRRLIVTVTKQDADYYGTSITALANVWRDQLQQQLEVSLWERQHWYEKLPAVRNVALRTLAIAIALVLVYRFLGRQSFKLKQRLDSESEFVSLESPEAQTALSAQSQASSQDLPQGLLNGDRTVQAEIRQPQSNHSHRSHRFRFPFRDLADFAVPHLLQLSVKRRYSLFRLLRLVLFWIQIFNLCLGISFCLAQFPDTRTSGLAVLSSPIMLILVWVAVTIGIRVSVFVIDWQLERWARNAIQHSVSDAQRYTRRASTYANVSKELANIFFYLNGIVITANILIKTLLGVGLSESLTSVGVIGIVLSFLFQNSIKDVVTGCFILIGDRFILGDVVEINGKKGNVENVNLFMTQLRTSRGHLVTLPNSSILAVENMTKHWSRVNFEIVVAPTVNIKEAIALITTVAEQMRSDPMWQEKILEPINVQGIYDISATGIKLGAWIKTQPGDQWNVEYELRLRLLQAFEQQGIALSASQPVPM